MVDKLFFLALPKYILAPFASILNRSIFSVPFIDWFWIYSMHTMNRLHQFVIRSSSKWCRKISKKYLIIQSKISFQNGAHARCSTATTTKKKYINIKYKQQHVCQYFCSFHAWDRFNVLGRIVQKNKWSEI